MSEGEVETILRRGEIRLAIVIPQDVERGLYHDLPTTVHSMVDGVYSYLAKFGNRKIRRSTGTLPVATRP